MNRISAMRAVYFFLSVCIIVSVGVGVDIARAFYANRQALRVPTITPFWEYECIDTMKSSRDLAGEYRGKADAETLIAREVGLIAETGANCIAIATPYDEEFLPVLRMWVQAARKERLHVWFRGNWSEWEGWYGRKNTLTPESHVQLTREFIYKNRELFADGDIFTGAPEAENGGYFAGKMSVQTFPVFRKFLRDEYDMATAAFEDLGLDVRVNWFSMNGWVARNMYDRDTLLKIGKTITIDHYTKDLHDMETYLNYFVNTYGATVNLGEFGAPIPDLNGEMSESEQAEYLNSLMHLFYKYRAHIGGLNYWTFRFGSTHLVNDDFSKREAFTSISRFYRPGVVYGRIVNSLGEPIVGARIQVEEYGVTVVSDSQGEYVLQLPAGAVKLSIGHPMYQGQTFTLVLGSDEFKKQYFSLSRRENSRIDELRNLYLRFVIPRT